MSNENKNEYKTDRKTMYEAAKFYTEHGWIIHALSKPNGTEDTAGKAPITRGWQKQQAPRTEKYIDSNWGNFEKVPYNIGLQCGELSGVCVLDCDDNNPYIIDALFEGLDKSTWVKQQRTPSRLHYFFKFDQRLPTTKHYKIVGIDFLSNGGNCVLSPSNHKSGDVYAFENGYPAGSEALPEMPEKLVKRLLELFKIAENLKQAVRNSRECFSKFFTYHAEKSKDPENWHSEEGRQAALATGIELATNGAKREELFLMAKIMYRDHYEEVETTTQIDSILRYKSKPEGKPWKCETIRANCPRITVNQNSSGMSLCDGCKKKDIEPRARKPASMEKTVEFFHFLNKGEQQDLASSEFLKRYPCVHFKGYGLATYKDGIYVQLQPEEAQSMLLKMVNEWDYAPTVNELKNIQNMIEIKAHKPETMFLGENNPELVALDNGLLNLYTGELTEYNKDMVIFNKLNVTYNPKATNKPMFDKFISEVFKGNETGILQYQELGGYCLFRGYPIHAFIVFIGTGGNGKSQLIQIIADILGKENITAYSMQDFFSPKEPSITASHHNKMANLSSENEDDPIKSTKTGKALTGGDAVTARKLYCDPFTFISFSKSVFSANSTPIIEDNTGGLIQRMIPILLPNKFRGTKNQILKIATAIREAGEQPAILNWFIEGFRRLMAQKHFTRKNSAESDSVMYSRLSRPFDYFVEEYCCESNGFDTEYTTVEDVTKALMKYREMYPQSADFGDKFKFKSNLETACRKQGLRKVRYAQKRVTPGCNPQKVYMNLTINERMLNEDYDLMMHRRAKERGEELEPSTPLPELTKTIEKTQEEKDTDSAVSLMIRALTGFLKSPKYNGIVTDVNEFVEAFNRRDPEFCERLGHDQVHSMAVKVIKRGYH